MSGTTIKIIALITMLMDHIWQFIPNTPFFFHWLGRISAPIFIFCCVIAYDKTRDKKKYMLRLYILSLIMGVINYTLNIRFNFIRTLLILLMTLFLYDNLKNKDKMAWRTLILFIIWQIVILLVMLLMNYKLNIDDRMVLLIFTLSGSVFVLDGGLLFVFIGIAMYMFKNCKVKFTVTFLLIDVINIIVCNTNIMVRVLGKASRYSYTLHGLILFFTEQIFGTNPIFANIEFLYGDCQWLMILSLPFICMYNGKKGKDIKYLFYIFYPVHIIILFIISKYFFV